MIRLEIENAHKRGINLKSRQYMLFNPLRAQVDYHLSLVEEFGGPPVVNPDDKIKRREKVFDLRRIHAQKL